MSGPHTEGLPLPEPDPEWLARYEAKMADLMAARAERLAARSEQTEPDEDTIGELRDIERLQDRLYAERSAGRRPPRPPLPDDNEGDQHAR